MADTVQSTNELDERQKLAQVLNETLLSSMAAEEERMARARTEAANIEVGTTDPKEQNYVVPAGGSIIKTFGSTKAVTKDGVTTVTTPAATPKPGYEVDVKQVATQEANKQPTLDIEKEMTNLRGMTNPDEKDVAAQQLYVNIGQQASVAQERIRALAAQRSGSNDAQAALDKWIALENAAHQTGKLRMGDHYAQTDAARVTLQHALQTSNQLETDLIKQDPQLQKYTDYRALLNREFGQINRAQDRQDRNVDQFGALTPERLTNAKLAIGMKETDSVKLTSAVYNELKKNKALHSVLDVGKSDYPAALASPDIEVRRYAYNIIAGKEAALNGGVVPDYVKKLEPVIMNRRALLTPDQNKVLDRPSKTTGQKAHEEEQGRAIAQGIAGFIEMVGRNKYMNMSSWVFPDEGMKKVIDSVKATAKDQRVLRSDGIDAIMKADLKNPDGTVMSAQQKVTALVQSIDITMRNDKKSAILPDADTYGAMYAAETRNEAMRSYIRGQNTMGLVPYMPLTGGSSVFNPNMKGLGE